MIPEVFTIGEKEGAYFWESTKSVIPGINIAMSKQADLAVRPLKIIAPFCPLYAPGDLQNSELILPGMSIGESRVSGKWNALTTIWAHLKKVADELAIPIQIHTVFANRGVLLGRDPNQNDFAALEYHKTLYALAVGEFFAASGIDGTFSSYDEHMVALPTFVNPKSEFPNMSGLESEISYKVTLDCINRYIALFGREAVVNNNDNRQIIKGIQNAFGAQTTAWLVAGYLAFDDTIASIVGPGGVYLSTERFAPLFRVAKLTPSLQQVHRVEILA